MWIYMHTYIRILCVTCFLKLTSLQDLALPPYHPQTFSFNQPLPCHAHFPLLLPGMPSPEPLIIPNSTHLTFKDGPWIQGFPWNSSPSSQFIQTTFPNFYNAFQISVCLRIRWRDCQPAVSPPPEIPSQWDRGRAPKSAFLTILPSDVDATGCGPHL